MSTGDSSFGGAELFVVAGTDTEIGKTTVACSLLSAWSERGRDVRGIKPVESGTAEQDRPEHEDGRRLATAAGQTEPEEAFQRLEAPLAPPVAARDEGVELRPADWIASAREIAAEAEVSLVEGAGGLLSPLSDDFTTRHLARALEAPVILVAADSLGTLNHTFLTIEAIEASELDIAAVIFSAPEEPDASTGRNEAVVRRRRPELDVASLPRIETPEAGGEILWSEGIARRLVGDGG